MRGRPVLWSIALITAVSWWKQPGKVNRWRVIVIGIAWAMVIVGWPRPDVTRLLPSQMNRFRMS